MNIFKKIKTIAFLLLLAGVGKFYHYNYIENTIGQARLLKINGLRGLVCGDRPMNKYVDNHIDHCDKRSIYSDEDWGITSYIYIWNRN